MDRKTVLLFFSICRDSLVRFLFCFVFVFLLFLECRQKKLLSLKGSMQCSMSNSLVQNWVVKVLCILKTSFLSDISISDKMFLRLSISIVQYQFIFFNSLDFRFWMLWFLNGCRLKVIIFSQWIFLFTLTKWSFSCPMFF